MGTFATSWTAGDVIPASELNTLSGAWTSYTPTVGGAGWALGNGTISGAYKKIGRTVVFHILVTWGSTSTFGASALSLTAPVTAGARTFLLKVVAVDNGTATYDGTAVLAASTATITPYVTGTASTYATTGTIGYTTSVPHGWANTDYIIVQGEYESAS